MSHPLQCFQNARKLAKSPPCCKRNGHSIFRDIFIKSGSSNGQYVPLHGFMPGVFNLSAGEEPQGNTSVPQETPIHTFTYENVKLLSTKAFVEFLAEPLGCARQNPRMWVKPGHKSLIHIIFA